MGPSLGRRGRRGGTLRVYLAGETAVCTKRMCGTCAVVHTCEIFVQLGEK